MAWMLAASILIAGTLSTMTDWLFMGVLFHRHYGRYPETWWPEFRETGDRRTIVVSSVLAYVTTAAVVALCAAARTHGIAAALTLSALAWAAGPLVVLVTNGLWIRIDPRVTFAHCLGWLARFVIAAVAAGIVLR